MADATATAEGELARTPLAHLLVYALDRKLTGALFLAPPGGGTEHVVRLVRGVPVKVRPGDRFSPLGEMLIDAGAIDEATLQAALATKGLLGDVLLLAGRVERDTLEKVAEAQFEKRMVRLFALPQETTYRYHDGHEALAEYGGDPACVDPLALLWAGLRIHGDLSAMLEGTLTRLGDAPLRLSPAATVARFGLDAEELELLEVLCRDGAAPVTLADLSAASFPGLARRFVYALAITRQLEMGTGLLPLGADVVPSSSQRNAPPATAVARMALKSTVHRLGAAAPDAPGDGERGFPVISSRRGRERPDGSSDEPPSSRPSAVPPVSSVVSVPVPVSGVVATSDEIVPVPVPVPAAPSGPREEERERVRERERADAEAAVESTLVSAIEGAPTTRGSAPDVEAEAAPDEVAAALEAIAGEEAEPPSAPAKPPSAPAAEIAEVGEGFAGMSPEELYWLASESLSERDMEAAMEACAAGRRAAPDHPDLRALEAWVQAQSGGADIKALAVQLDEILGDREDHVEARYYRGMLRRRLGDEEGSSRDLRQVLALSPGHAGASLALEALEQRQRKSVRPSLFGKLFKR